MYTILVNDDNTLVRTKVETIMERSTNVNQIHFLVNQIYHSQQNDSLDMGEFQAILEYKLPISKQYITEALVASDGLYKDTYIEYKLPVDTSFTKESGNIEIQLTFTDVKTNVDGTSTQYVRKTQPTTIFIAPITNWSSTIPDASLTAIDQRLIAMDGIVQSLNNVIQQYQNNAAVGLKLDGDKLYLIKADGTQVGNSITMNTTLVTETTGDMKVVSI